MTRETDAARRARLRSALVKAARAEDAPSTLCASLIAITAAETAAAATSPAAAGKLGLAPTSGAASTVATGANEALRWKLVAVLLALGAAGAGLIAKRETANESPVATMPTMTTSTSGQPAPVVAAPTAAVPIAVPAETASVSTEDLPSVKSARTAPPARPPTAPVSAASVAAMGAPVDRATAAPVSAPARPTARLADETRALGAIRAAVYAGEASNALRLLDAYEGEFPSGVLAEEAEVLRIEAFARAGNRAELVRCADRFLTERPSSAHAARVSAIKERHAASGRAPGR